MAISRPRLSKEDRLYQARDDLNTLRRAKEISGNRSRVTAAQSVARQELKALQQITKPSRMNTRKKKGR